MFFDEQPKHTNGLEARLDAQHVDAAREYLHRFLNNEKIKRDRMFQALTILLVDLDKADHS